MNTKILRMKTLNLGFIPSKFISNIKSNNQTLNLSINQISNELKIEPILKRPPRSTYLVLSKQPKLIYVQNPLVWLRNKLRLRLLRYTWDGDFEEKEFKRGATQVNSVYI